MRVVDELRGHLWTVWPHLRHLVRPPTVPSASPWHTSIHDPTVGALRLSGLIDHVAGADRIAIVLHGMGGSATRGYCAAAAVAARAAGMSSLRLNLRGADGSGEDFYHIGLTEDVAAALAEPSVARYRCIYLIGFSLGGHIALRYALLGGAATGVVSICAPLDLHAAVAHIDHPRLWVYRQHLLNGLKQTLRQVALKRRDLAARWPRIRAIRSIREWDEMVVAPRFGFAGADDYYTTVAVGPRLGAMRARVLVIASDADPMVPARTLRPALSGASGSIEVRWARGGHVGFPGDARLMEDVMEWLAALV